MAARVHRWHCARRLGVFAAGAALVAACSSSPSATSVADGAPEPAPLDTGEATVVAPSDTDDASVASPPATEEVQSTSSSTALEEPCVLAPDTRVVDLTFDELRRYELNNGEPVPTLEEYLDLADAAGVGVLPEIKTFAATEGAAPEPWTVGQLEQYTAMLDARTGIPEVLIGSFDTAVLTYFAEARPEWTRVWFRSLGGQDPVSPPTVDEMRRRAPSAGVLGVLNALYTRGTSPLDDQEYDVPGEFAAAGIPIYIWFNVLTGGDSAADGEGALGASPGWASLTALDPANITWIATDTTAAYAEWAASLRSEGRTAPAMVAHRGGGSEAISENSLAAFRQAVADGAAYLETDVQWTRPTPDAPHGVPVLMHDATINRTMRCPG